MLIARVIMRASPCMRPALLKTWGGNPGAAGDVSCV